MNHLPNLAVTITTLAACLTPALATAQATRYAVSPAGFAHISGNTNNNAPFYGASARYHQIHDAVDMQALTGSPTLIITGMAFRPSATFTISAQKWDLQISLAHTSVNHAGISTTFANNFSATPTVVLPYTTINGPAGKGQGSSRPNDLLYVIPFTTPFPYLAPRGNLCWEWRHKNNAVSASISPMDAISSSFTGAVTVGANYGTGCTAFGQSSPATCSHAISGGNVNLSLSNGRANSPAMMWLGLQSAQIPIPGWCAPVHVNILVGLPGMTTSNGSWASGTGPTSFLNVSPYYEIYTQYAFVDGSQTGGIGLSDRGVICAPAHGSKYVSRAYVNNRSGNGSENATTGSVLGQNYGLITSFAVQ